MASTTAPTIVANSTNASVIMVSICEPISAAPSWKVGLAGRAPGRRGQGAAKIPAPSRAKAPIETASEPGLLWYMLIWISPAGFIMYATMNTAMMIISMTIMRMTTTPR